MRYRKLSRLNRCGFSMAQIGLMIELAVYSGHSNKAIAQTFGCSDKTIAYYMEKYYYGRFKGKKLTITLPSKINEEIEIAA